MRLKLIACKVLTREISALCANSPHYIDVTFLRQDFHNDPALLQKTLQMEIDRIDRGEDVYSCSGSMPDYDAVLLGYGLCGGGTCGISSRKYPLVLPRAADCITLLLGSRERYRRAFEEESGTFWYTEGWVENSPVPDGENEEAAYEKYRQIYDDESARFLAAEEERFVHNYRRAAVIGKNADHSAAQEAARKAADAYGWSYIEYEYDNRLLYRLLNGIWDDSDFLILPKGHSARQSYGETILEDAGNC